MKKRIVFTVLSIVVIAGGVYGYFFGDTSTVDEPGPLVLYGNVDVRQVELAFNVGGPVVRLLAEEGDRVKKGDLLAELEADSYRHATEAAEGRLKALQAVLARLEAGSRPEEIARARALVADAKARLTNAEATRTRRAHLVDRGDASRQAFDDSVAEEARARALLAARQQDLALAVEGPRVEDIAEARAQVEAARAELAARQYALSRTRLLAPSDGVILTRIREPGAVVQAQTPVYALTIDNPVWVRGFVPETDLGRLRPGMSGEVSPDGASARIYKGRVGFISPTAEFTPKTVETPDLRTSLVYRFRLYIDNPDHGLRQGMPVTIRLFGRE